MSYIEQMVIDWTRVRKVICNDRIVYYKPDRRCLDFIGQRLADARIHGFGVYSVGMFKTWYVMVESSAFYPDEQPGIQVVSMRDLPILTIRNA